MTVEPDVGLDVADVPVVVDGSPLIATFQVDRGEHRRRVQGGLGAVTSTGLLHGLWLLPPGIPVPADHLPEVKVERLRATLGWVIEDDAGFMTSYSPAGRVLGFTACGTDTGRVIDLAARISRVFRRDAVVTGRTRVSDRMVDRARDLGVGLQRVTDADSVRLVDPAPAIIGVPGVYRWWVAELAYEAWIQASTQLVSCDFGLWGPRNPPLS